MFIDLTMKACTLDLHTHVNSINVSQHYWFHPMESSQYVMSVVYDLTYKYSQLPKTSRQFSENLAGKSIVRKIFDQDVFIRTLPTTLLQIFCKTIPTSKVVV